MTEKEFRRSLDAIWRRRERAHGIKRVPPELRQMLERRCLAADHGSKVDLRDFEDDADAFIEGEFPIIMDFARMQAANPQAERLPDNVKLRGRDKIYEKPFRRRLRILDFVAQRQVPFAYLLQRELGTAGRRIAWKKLCAEWNKAHPDDAMTPEQLRVMYGRARREKYLCETYFDGKFRDWARQAEHLRPILGPLELSGRRPEDLFVRSIRFDSSRLRDALPQEVAAAFTRRRRQAEWLAVWAKYPPARRSARRQRTADKARRRRPTVLVCKGRACNSASAMLVFWFPEVTTVLKGRQCERCGVASRMMSELPAAAGESGAT